MTVYLRLTDVAGDNQPLALMRYPDWFAAGITGAWTEYRRDGLPVKDAAAHRAAQRAAGMATAGYINLCHGNAAWQMWAFLQDAPAGELPDMLDVEELSLTDADVRAACETHDATGRQLVIYTGYSAWVQIIPPAARAYYKKYKVVIGAYPHDTPPTLVNGKYVDIQPMDSASVARRSTPPAVFVPPVPEPWTVADVLSWQYTGHGSLPGYAGFLDLHIGNPALLPGGEKPMPSATSIVPQGDLSAIYADQPGQIVDLYKRHAAAGAPFASAMVLNDAGVCRDLKLQVVPPPLTQLRYYNPNDDSLQGLDNWTTSDRQAWVARVLEKIYSQLTAEMALYVDWCGAWNEEDPPGPFGYKDLGETMILLMQENEKRKALGQVYVKLALLALAQGTPEWWEMQQLVATGMFQMAEALGYLCVFHEGVYRNQPIWFGWKDVPHPNAGRLPLAPGSLAWAPEVLNAGSACLRFLYITEGLLRPLGVRVLVSIQEWYDGGTGLNIQQRLGAWTWYDDLLSLYDYVLGFAPFASFVTPDWSSSDMTPISMSDDYLAWRLARAKRKNGGLMTVAMKDEDFAQLVAGNQQQLAAAQRTAAVLAIYQPAAHAWQAGDVAVATANPLLIYNEPGGHVISTRSNYTADQHVLAVSADGQWLQVFAAPVMWVRAADVNLK